MVERATAPETPQDVLQRTLLWRCRGPQLVLVRLATCGLIAHRGLCPSGGTQAVGDQDVWLTPAAPHRQG
jgi:hypothetical protein